MTPDPQQAVGPSDRALDLTNSGPGRRPGRRWIVWSLMLAALVAGAATLLIPSRESTRYVTVAAEPGDLRVTVSATGQLEPVNQVDVGTEVSGTIRSVAVDFNDRVTQGQVLARLDTDELEAQVVQGRASLRAAKARVEQTQATREEARLQRDRCKELARTAMCAQADLDASEASYLRAQADVSSAEAQVELAQAALAANETRLDKAEIRAPMNGLVLARRIEPGQTVAASLQTPVLFVLAEDLRDMELHVDVDEADVGQVHEGQSATFTVDAYPAHTFPATITQVRFAPDSEGGVVTYETVLSVDNSDLLLRPGMTATAEILVAEVTGGLLVPNAALRFLPPSPGTGAAVETGGGFLDRLLPRPPRRRSEQQRSTPQRQGPGQEIWILRNGEPAAVPVDTGPTDGARTEILGGALAPGDLVITGIETPRP